MRINYLEQDPKFDETKSLIDKYKEEKALIEIDGSKNPEDNMNIITKILGVNND